MPTAGRWFGASTDMHDSKRIRAEREGLLAAQQSAGAESERAGRMKDEFLATLSPGLGTPLNAIVGGVAILKSAAAEVETVSEGLAVIDRNARAQTQIIANILDMSRIISGKLRPDVRPAAKGVRLTADLDPEADGISGDPNRLHQGSGT